MKREKPTGKERPPVLLRIKSIQSSGPSFGEQARRWFTLLTPSRALSLATIPWLALTIYLGWQIAGEPSTVPITVYPANQRFASLQVVEPTAPADGPFASIAPESIEDLVPLAVASETSDAHDASNVHADAGKPDFSAGNPTAPPTVSALVVDRKRDTQPPSKVRPQARIQTVSAAGPSANASLPANIATAANFATTSSHGSEPGSPIVTAGLAIPKTPAATRVEARRVANEVPATNHRTAATPSTAATAPAESGPVEWTTACYPKESAAGGTRGRITSVQEGPRKLKAALRLEDPNP